MNISADNCEITGCDAKYLSHYTDFNWDPFDGSGGAENGSQGVLIDEDNNLISNCSFKYSAGSGIVIFGGNNVVTRSIISDTDYSGLYSACVVIRGSTGNNQLLFNSIYNTGRDVIRLKGTNNDKVMYNDLYNAGRLCEDNGITYQHGTDGKGTEIAYNWVHDNLSHSANPGIYHDNYCTNFTVHHNVIWNCEAGVRHNRPRHRLNVYNNTLFNCLNVATRSYNAWPNHAPSWWTFGDADRHDLRNNLYLNTNPGSQLVNYANNDFRLKAGASAINAGVRIAPYTNGFVGANPDLGAYERGKPRWTAGHDGALNADAPVTTTYRLTINGGSGSGLYPEGTVVNITAGAAPAGQVFDVWLTGATANVGDLNDPTTTFTTRATASTLTANYKDAPVTTTYRLNINGGSGTGLYLAGTVVNIAADTAPAGQVFDAWLTGATANVGNLNDPTTTFTTRATASTVAATYKDAPITTTYRLNINGGSGTGLYPAGTVVNIAADAAPAGQVFDAWLTGATANLGDLSDPTTTFTTRATPSTVAAIYKDAPVTTTYRLTINGGTGSGFYPEGTVINITADAPPAGKVFDTWLTGATANVGDLTNPTTTFTTRATASTVAAIYKDVVIVSDLDTTILANMYDSESHELDDLNVRDAGTKIASIRNGNWVVYNDFNFGTGGVASVGVSASTGNPSGGTIEFRLGSPTGTLISSVEVDEDVTGGGWNTFATFSNTLSANVTGAHDLYLTFVGSGSGVLMHVRDFLFVSGSGDLGSNYYAESFNEESHPGNDTIIVRQGTNVAKIKDGSWINFLDYNFGSGASNIEVSAANDNLTADGEIKFRLGSPTGTLIGTVVVSDTGGWNTFEDFSTNQVTSVPGVHDLYLEFTGNGNVIMKLGTLQID